MNPPGGEGPASRPWVTRSRQSAPFVLLLVGAVALSFFVPDVSAIWVAIAALWASVLILMRRDPPPSGSWWSRWVVPFAPFALLVFVVVGLSALAFELSAALMSVIFVVAVILSVARWKLTGPRWAVLVVVIVGAIAVPVLALLGFDALWATIVRWVPPPWLSFPFGAALIMAATLLYRRPWWVRDPAKHPLAATLVVVVVLVVAQPVAALVIAANDDKGTPLGKRPVAVSQLDMIVLRDSSDRTKLALPASTGGWQVTTWVGPGQRPERCAGAAAANFRAGCRRGRRPRAAAGSSMAPPHCWTTPGRCRTHRRRREKSGGGCGWPTPSRAGATPTFALLQTTDQNRLERSGSRPAHPGERGAGPKTARRRPVAAKDLPATGP